MEQKLFIDGIQSGQVFINAIVASDPAGSHSESQEIRLRMRAGVRNPRIREREDDLDSNAIQVDSAFAPYAQV